jgi:WD40-like Beta Propeller Repeat
MIIRSQALIAATFLLAATLGQTGASAGAFPGVNGKIAFVGEGHIGVINADGTGRATLDAAAPASTVNQPAWNALGTKLAFRKGGSSIMTMNADGSSPKLLVTMPSFVGNPTWSPDGSVIAFDAFIGGPQQESRIYTVPATGGMATELVALDAQDPTYSPDGTMIAYEESVGDSDIGVMNADGSEPRNITIGTGGNNADFDPSWHPDGRIIAFTRHSTEIWNVDVGGGGGSRVTALNLDDSPHPTFSPDGDKIAFTIDGDLWMVDKDGSNIERITDTPDVDEIEPDWGVAPTVHPRDVSLALTGHLQVTGRITMRDGFEPCMANVPVKITRNGQRLTRTTTDNSGAYSVKLRDRLGQYKAVLPKLFPAEGSICSKAASPVKRHRH